MTFPPEERFTMKVFKDWLSDKIDSKARIVIGRLPSVPNRVIGLLPQTGPGTVMEGMFDVVGFQVSCRGGENNFEDAEAIALEIDSLLIGGDENFMMEDVYVSGLGRIGSGPTTTSLPDSDSRWTFTCTYFAYVSTSVGQVN